MSDQPEMTDTSDGCLRGALQDTGTQASRQLTRAISPARPETADRASEETTLQERARVALRNTLIGVFSSPMQVSTPIFLSTMELDRIIAAVVEVFRATPSAEVIEAGAIAIFASRFGADPEFTAAASKDWPKFDESVHEEFRRQSRAAYQAMESAKATEWRGFDVRPSEPMMVEYYFGNYPLFAPETYRDDERRGFGFWDGKVWREWGAENEVFETWKTVETRPTHWRQATEPPK